ncbi:hypothetical protein K457DRAFT_23626 [Linnemannia elongata AG-77]|uniref:Uncharacterized protein n=1 Tax=Linnemannia elongata AG-77 TaxID=1314771 RepID=A0A197JIT4_9FUNG|nr:hypothetical protein K457DRAFT_23626 [Linnemannia elongata AG-77]
MTNPLPVPDLVSTPVHDPVTDPCGDSSQPPFYNMAVKQKAIYQPVFRHRKWLENEKGVTPEGEEESVADLESRLPPPRGQSGSVMNHVGELELVWLLNVVVGSLGRRVEDNEDKDPILFGVGLGQFSSDSKLSSLHSTFLSTSYILFLASVVSVAIITTTAAPMPSVSEVVKPVLKAASSLTNGLDNGLTQSAGQVQTGVNSAGVALNSVTRGVGCIAQGLVSGLGNTVGDMPKALNRHLTALGHANGLVSILLNSLL